MSLAAAHQPETGGDAAVAAFAAAIAGDFAVLAGLHDLELTAQSLAALRACGIADQLGLSLTSRAGRAALAACDKAIADLPGGAATSLLDALAADYADVYYRYAYRVSPSESVWLTEDHLERQGPMFAVEAWYRRHGLKVDDSAGRASDHIVMELRFLAYLAGEARDAAGLREVAQFLDAHPLRWVAEFAGTLDERQGPPLYVALAVLTAAYLDEVRGHLAGITGLARPATAAPETPAAKRREPTCGDPDERPFLPGAAPSW